MCANACGSPRGPFFSSGRLLFFRGLDARPVLFFLMGWADFSRRSQGLPCGAGCACPFLFFLCRDMTPRILARHDVKKEKGEKKEHAHDRRPRKGPGDSGHTPPPQSRQKPRGRLFDRAPKRSQKRLGNKRNRNANERAQRKSKYPTRRHRRADPQRMTWSTDAGKAGE